MRTLFVPLVLALLTLAAGCDPCASYTGTTYVDEHGVLEPGVLADLEATYDRFVAATGPGRVCIDRVEVLGEDEGDGAVVYGGPDWVIELDPGYWPTKDLRAHLCSALDLHEDLDAQAGDLFGENGFAGACVCVNPDFAWHEQVSAACGGSPLSEDDQFMAEHAFPAAAVGRVDGPLGVTTGAPVRLAGLGLEYVRSSAPLGEGLLLHLESYDDVSPERVVHVDLNTLVVTDIVSAVRFEALYGGTDAAVVREPAQDGGESLLHVIDADTLAVTPLTTTLLTRSLRAGAVSAGTLYLATDGIRVQDPIEAIDLATGTTSQFALPAAEAPLSVLPRGITPVPGGFVLDYSEADVRTEGDSTTIGVGDRLLARWSVAEGGWTGLTRGVEFVPLGATAEGRLVGTLHGAGALVGAYTYDADHLAVSDGLCLAETGIPDTFAADRAWLRVVDGKDLVLTPFLLD